MRAKCLDRANQSAMWKAKRQSGVLNEATMQNCLLKLCKAGVNYTSMSSSYGVQSRLRVHKAPQSGLSTTTDKTLVHSYEIVDS